MSGVCRGGGTRPSRPLGVPRRPLVNLLEGCVCMGVSLIGSTPRNCKYAIDVEHCKTNARDVKCSARRARGASSGAGPKLPPVAWTAHQINSPDGGGHPVPKRCTTRNLRWPLDTSSHTPYQLILLLIVDSSRTVVNIGSNTNIRNVYCPYPARIYTPKLRAKLITNRFHLPGAPVKSL